MHRDPPFLSPGREPDLAKLSTQAVAAAVGALAAITDAHSLTAIQRERLESAYVAIGDHLAAHPNLGNETLEVHPQGSMLIGTTTRPEGKAEMDVDLVLLLRQGLHADVACGVLLDAVHEALLEHAARHDLTAERKRRCVQLQYANEMHADVTPVVHHPRPFGLHGDTFGLVPDRDLSRYMGTNPKGYGQWFDAAASRLPLFSLRRDLEVVARADVVPLPTLAVFDRLLSRIVQLFKIHRNVMFAARQDLSPPSVFITTLVVHAYLAVLGEVFVSPLDLLLRIWRDIPRYILREPVGLGHERWIVDNPTAVGDNLADRMNTTADRQSAFDTWHARFGTDLLEVFALPTDPRRGGDELSKQVTIKFGAHAGRGITDGIRTYTEAQRARGIVSMAARVAAAPAIAAAPSIVVASQSHRFFGRRD